MGDLLYLQFIVKCLEHFHPYSNKVTQTKLSSIFEEPFNFHYPTLQDLTNMNSAHESEREPMRGRILGE